MWQVYTGLVLKLQLQSVVPLPEIQATLCLKLIKTLCTEFRIHTSPLLSIKVYQLKFKLVPSYLNYNLISETVKVNKYLNKYAFEN